MAWAVLARGRKEEEEEEELAPRGSYSGGIGEGLEGGAGPGMHGGHMWLAVLPAASTRPSCIARRETAGGPAQSKQYGFLFI
jgi:hypothetical protein